jgi:multicomponent Na+:H+ antiporter subunit F
VSAVFMAAVLVSVLLTGPFIGRVISGPTIFDRVLALNGIGTLVPVILVLAGLIYGRLDMYVDLVLALFLLNLFTTLLVASYVRRRAEAQ